MKNNLSFPFLFVLFCSLISCRELPPLIDFGVQLRDTTYVTGAIPAQEKTKIFIEDLTGVRCNNCPKAAERLHNIIVANPGNVIGVAVYSYSISTLTAPWENFDTLNTIDADVIFNTIYGSPSAIPAGGVNRRVFPGETSTNVSSTKWSGYADLVKIQESPIVLSAKVMNYDDVTRIAKIQVKVIFAKAYKEALDLSVFLTESKILSKQKLEDGTEKDDYEHNHVLRRSLTSFPLKTNAQTIGNYEAGRVFEKDFEVTLKSKWKKQNCSFAIIVNHIDNSSKEVVQAFELPLQ